VTDRALFDLSFGSPARVVHDRGVKHVWSVGQPLSPLVISHAPLDPKPGDVAISTGIVVEEMDVRFVDGVPTTKFKLSRTGRPRLWLGRRRHGKTVLVRVRSRKAKGRRRYERRMRAELNRWNADQQRRADNALVRLSSYRVRHVFASQVMDWRGFTGAVVE
jgi:hypothetical protein